MNDVQFAQVPTDQVPPVDMDTPERIEQRRMWCLVQSIALAVNVARVAQTLTTVDIMQTAEEMLEFVETGTARTPGVKQSKSKH